MAFPTLYTVGVGDLASGLQNWRIWHLLGVSDLRRRHARSWIGQFWLTLSSAVNIIVLGLVWSLLWRMPLEGIFPYISVAMIFWGLIAAIVNEATVAFTSHGHLFINSKTSFSVTIYALCYRNLLILGYNVVIIVGVFIWFRLPINPRIILVLPALLVTFTFLFSVAFIVAIITTRFRDAIPITASIMQIAYFVTPVLWKPDFLPEAYRWINLVNPFASMLSILRDPILGLPTPLQTWELAICYAGGAFLLAIPFIGYFRNRLIYWI